MILLQPEEQKSFGSKVRAARGEPRSSHPAAPAHGTLSVPSTIKFGPDFIWMWQSVGLKMYSMVAMPVIWRKIKALLGKR